MSEKDGKFSRKRELDDFWNIDFITPQKHTPTRPPKRSTETVEITVSSVLESISDTKVYGSQRLSGAESGVIRKIVSDDNSQNTPELEYSPENSLIHKVRIFKWRSPYSYYEEFYRDAERLLGAHGDECPRVGFFSYVPQYDQLSPAQLAYYLYFRERAREGVFIDADYSYILLYVYEILNLGEALDTRYGQAQLTALWRAYRERYPKLNKSLIEWICDYSLIHRLPPPANIELASVAEVSSLKEFFIEYKGRDYAAYADILLAFCSSYDFHGSKFAVGEALEVYERYIPLALGECVRALSGDGVLSKVGFNDSRLPRDAYSGALCSHRIKRKIEVEYCSFSRTNELRYLVGDIVKYSENKIRAYLGIKPRLSCYSLDVDMRKLLDGFFGSVLPRSRRPRLKEKRQEYDVLYDLPAKPLSLSDASQIEEESWETTKNLVEAFGAQETESIEPCELEEDIFSLPSIESDTADGEEDILSALGELREFALAVYRKDGAAQREIAAALGRMPDSIVDGVNEISVELIGDILIEDDGEYKIVEDYEFYFTGAEN